MLNKIKIPKIEPNPLLQIRNQFYKFYIKFNPFRLKSTRFNKNYQMPYQITALKKQPNPS